MDELVETKITGFQEDFEEFENFGFNLSRQESIGGGIEV